MQKYTKLYTLNMLENTPEIFSWIVFFRDIVQTGNVSFILQAVP